MHLKKKDKDILHFAIPLLIGVSIYVLFRGIPFFNLDGLLLLEIKPNSIISLFLYNLPDAIWFYSLLIIFKIIWGSNLLSDGKYWVLTVITLVILSEFLQKINWLTGTFDSLDLIAYTISLFLFLLLNKNLIPLKIKLT